MQLADLKPKPWGKCLESLSISKTAQHLLGAFIFSFSIGLVEEEKEFSKGMFLVECCHLYAPECKLSEHSLTDDSVLEKCPFVEKADIF